MKRKIVWTDAHRAEAEPRTYEIAAEQIRAGDYDGDKFGELVENAKREDWWRSAFAEMRLDPARIDREVRRVNGLATGRLVRETSWGVRAVDASRKASAALTQATRGGVKSREDAHRMAKQCGGTPLAFTRIRRRV